jgi:hypothetical protein
MIDPPEKLNAYSARMHKSLATRDIYTVDDYKSVFSTMNDNNSMCRLVTNQNRGFKTDAGVYHA